MVDNVFILLLPYQPVKVNRHYIRRSINRLRLLRIVRRQDLRNIRLVNFAHRLVFIAYDISLHIQAHARHNPELVHRHIHGALGIVKVIGRVWLFAKTQEQEQAGKKGDDSDPPAQQDPLPVLSRKVHVFSVHTQN